MQSCKGFTAHMSQFRSTVFSKQCLAMASYRSLFSMIILLDRSNIRKLHLYVIKEYNKHIDPRYNIDHCIGTPQRYHSIMIYEKLNRQDSDM